MTIESQCETCSNNRQLKFCEHFDGDNPEKYLYSQTNNCPYFNDMLTVDVEVLAEPV